MNKLDKAFSIVDNGVNPLGIMPVPQILAPEDVYF